MSTLAEVEAAASALPPEEQEALIARLANRLERSKGGRDLSKSMVAEKLVKTLRELSRPMGGKFWSNRDELHER